MLTRWLTCPAVDCTLFVWSFVSCAHVNGRCNVSLKEVRACVYIVLWRVRKRVCMCVRVSIAIPVQVPFGSQHEWLLLLVTQESALQFEE